MSNSHTVIQHIDPRVPRGYTVVEHRIEDYPGDTWFELYRGNTKLWKYSLLWDAILAARRDAPKPLTRFERVLNG